MNSFMMRKKKEQNGWDNLNFVKIETIKQSDGKHIFIVFGIYNNNNIIRVVFDSDCNTLSNKIYKDENYIKITIYVLIYPNFFYLIIIDFLIK